MTPARILVADDEPSMRWLLERVLRQAGHSVTVVEDGAGALAQAGAEPYDLAFVDVRMPGVDGLEVLSRLKTLAPDTAVIVMTAHGSVRSAVEAMQRGAYDYLTKPFDNDEVRLLAERALSARALAREVVELRTGIHEVWEFGALVGKSARMQEVYKTIGRIAGTDVTVLLRGESGTGKEVVARAIHHYSRRAGKPFVAVSCAAIPATLLESELFGHERGAFTDAHQRRLGRFELAQGGTMYLDEVGDLGPELQPKLLRVLQERQLERVGGGEAIPVDVRVVAATNRDLETLIRDGRFREDLYYRLNVVTLTLPPLRERIEDVPFLVDHFLGKYGAELGERAIATEALDRLMGYGWPGNVRELENVIQHAMVMAGGGVILPEHLPIAPGSGPPPAAAGNPRAARRAEARRVRPRPRPARVGEPLRSPDRAGGAPASPRGAARDGREPAARGGAPRHQPQHAAEEAPAARARGRLPRQPRPGGMSRLVLVCAGGAVGTGLRYLTGMLAVHWLGAGFPYGTLAVNLAGAFLIGLLQQLAGGLIPEDDAALPRRRRAGRHDDLLGVRLRDRPPHDSRGVGQGWTNVMVTTGLSLAPVLARHGGRTGLHRADELGAPDRAARLDTPRGVR